MPKEPWPLRWLYAAGGLDDRAITVRAYLFMWVNLILAVIFLLAAPLVWFLLADYSGRYVAWIANLANHRDPGLRAHYEVVSRFADKIPRLTATMVVVLSMWFAHMTVVYLRFHKLYQQGRLLVSDPKTPPSEPTTGGR